MDECLRPAQAFLKLENLQPIGASSCAEPTQVASLSAEDRLRGVISYSSGNHAQGVAYAARALGVKAIIVMPGNAPKNKLEATAALGAEIVTVGPGSEERRLRAEQLAAQHGYVIVPPYNDEKIIAGQGTVGLEILEDLPKSRLCLHRSRRRLISGISAASSSPSLTSTSSASSPNSPAMRAPASRPDASFPSLPNKLRRLSRRPAHAEHRRTQLPAYSDLRRQHRERHGSEIREATLALSGNPETVAEPSGAVSVAAFMFHSAQLPRTVNNVAVISGGNIDPEFLAELRNS